MQQVRGLMKVSGDRKARPPLQAICSRLAAAVLPHIDVISCPTPSKSVANSKHMSCVALL
jgi:hypothetical protein